MIQFGADAVTIALANWTSLRHLRDLTWTFRRDPEAKQVTSWWDDKPMQTDNVLWLEGCGLGLRRAAMVTQYRPYVLPLDLGAKNMVPWGPEDPATVRPNRTLRHQRWPQMVFQALRHIRTTWLDPELEGASWYAGQRQAVVYRALERWQGRDRQYAATNLRQVPALLTHPGFLTNAVTPAELFGVAARPIVRRLTGLPRIPGLVIRAARVLRQAHVREWLGEWYDALPVYNIDRWDRWKPMDRLVATLALAYPALRDAVARCDHPFRILGYRRGPVIDYLQFQLQECADYLADAPQRARSFAVMHRESLAWHQALAAGTAVRQRDRIDLPFPAPPVPTFTCTLDQLSLRGTWLDSHEALALEGGELRHCVGGSSYARSCIEGRYIIYRIEGDVRATLTINAAGDVLHFLGNCNARPERWQEWQRRIEAVLKPEHAQRPHVVAPHAEPAYALAYAGDDVAF